MTKISGVLPQINFVIGCVLENFFNLWPVKTPFSSLQFPIYSQCIQC